MKARKIFITMGMLAVALIFTAVLAACGGKKDSGGGSGGSSGSSSAKSSGGGKANPATDFKYELTKDGSGVKILGYIGKNGGKVVIPAKIEDYSVVSIGDIDDWGTEYPTDLSQAFAERSTKYLNDRPDEKAVSVNIKERTNRITSVVIPDSVTYIGAGAFASCEALKSITLPKGLKALGWAFPGSGITTIDIPEGATTIGSEAFFGCKNLTSVTLPESIATIDGKAFYGCSELTSVKLPSHQIKYTHDGNSWGAFGDCPKLSLATRKAIEESGYKDGFN